MVLKFWCWSPTATNPWGSVFAYFSSFPLCFPTDTVKIILFWYFQLNNIGNTNHSASPLPEPIGKGRTSSTSSSINSDCGSLGHYQRVPGPTREDGQVGCYMITFIFFIKKNISIYCMWLKTKTCYHWFRKCLRKGASYLTQW